VGFDWEGIGSAEIFVFFPRPAHPQLLKPRYPSALQADGVPSGAAHVAALPGAPAACVGPSAPDRGVGGGGLRTCAHGTAKHTIARSAVDAGFRAEVEEVHGVFSRALREADRRRTDWTPTLSLPEKQGLVPDLQIDG
jgi:hypothetical protein